VGIRNCPQAQLGLTGQLRAQHSDQIGREPAVGPAQGCTPQKTQTNTGRCQRFSRVDHSPAPGCVGSASNVTVQSIPASTRITHTPDTTRKARAVNMQVPETRAGEDTGRYTWGRQPAAGHCTSYSCLPLRAARAPTAAAAATAAASSRRWLLLPLLLPGGPRR
jgi:hypothetical protein